MTLLCFSHTTALMIPRNFNLIMQRLFFKLHEAAYIFIDFLKIFSTLYFNVNSQFVMLISEEMIRKVSNVKEIYLSHSFYDDIFSIKKHLQTIT